MDYDIALLKLSKTVTYTSAVRPISLPTSSCNFPAKTQCYVTGWGRIRESGPVSDRLREAKVPIIERNECEKMYRVHGSIVTERMICAGYKGGRIDSCQGDSGGPLVCQEGENKPFVLAGVVSWGFGCAGRMKPGVYANIVNLRCSIDCIIQEVQ